MRPVSRKKGRADRRGLYRKRLGNHTSLAYGPYQVRTHRKASDINGEKPNNRPSLPGLTANVTFRSPWFHDGNGQGMIESLAP